MAYEAGVGAALKVKNEYVNQLLGKRNVVACGVGFKQREGKWTDELCVVVSVTKKLPKAQLTAEDIVPQTLGEVKTDVLEIGVVRALQSHQDKWRPAPGGVSVGHVAVTAGTIGCLVQRGDEIFILSNNHVLANSNNAQIGDAILQPGRYDGGTMADQIATLFDFVPIDFGQGPVECPWAKTAETVLNALAQATGSSHRVMAVRQTAGVNQVDAALGKPLSPDLVTKEILEIGVPKGVKEAELGMAIQKSGRTTGLTHDRITQIDVTVQVNYDGQIATFTGQLAAGPMSRGGDSGSAVLTEDGYVVGLLFAGSDTTTFFNPIQTVLSALNVQVVT
ncbi:MAG: S1 family peptidase [Anaerolineae bacterium]|jgi:hypothetical protein|nr:S1 family peptidase [Anaerolineae bacterium]MDH7474612.1 hypothetical protein [Anaerolineae bacterium]